MMELELPTETSITALAAHLTAPAHSQTTAPHAAPLLVPYRGALTVQHLDAPEVETGALLASAAVHDLGWLRRVEVRGEDRFRWLSGMVTNTVEALADQSGNYNLVLSAQGRIQGDVAVWRRGNTLQLEIEAGQAEALLAHFDHFIIMDDVELVPVSGESSLGLSGPGAEQVLARLGLPVLTEMLTVADGQVDSIAVRVERGYGTLVPHYALWTSVELIPALWKALLQQGAQPVGAAALETIRIVEGIAAYGVDIQSRDLAQETSQVRALNFTKGCYLGQEIVERIRSRGQVHRHLRSLEIFPDTPGDLPAIGTEIRQTGGTAESKAAGTLTSVAALHLDGSERIFAIGMVRAEAEVGDAPLSYVGGSAQILFSNPKLTTA